MFLNNCNDSINQLHLRNIISDVLIVHQNIRSIRKNFDLFVANINAFKDKPSFIFLTEVWINNNELALYNLDGFTLFGACNDSYRSGGVIVYYNSRISCSPSAYNLTSADIVKVEWSLENDVYIFLCIYRLHATSLDIFLQEISQLIRSVKSKNLFVLGDINVDIFNFPSESDDYMFLMSSFGLESLINVPTRVTNSSSSCIDHFFARLKSNDLSCLRPSVIDLKISDHHFIEISFTIAKVLPSQTYFRPCRNPKINLEILFDLLDHMKWDFVLDCNDTSLALDLFLNTLLIILEQCHTHYRVKKVKLLQPWISFDLANRINKRNVMHKKLKNRSINPNLHSIYNSTCKKINEDIKKEKEAYYINRFSVNRGDVKKNWNLVNEILTKKPKSCSISNILLENGTILTSDSDISNELNSYFTSVANDLRVKHFSNVIPDSYDLPYDYCPETFFLTPVSNFEIVSIIESLEPKQSLDNEGLSNYILKAISKYVCPVITHIFNLSFIQGTVPERLKSAMIIPIFKNGDRKHRGNYRPIALQPVILKVLEKVVKNRVTLFLDRFAILSAHQHGFRQGMSTESALLEFLNNIYNGLNCGKFCAGLFVDATKAFDMVDHKRLLSILSDIGFRGASNKWFASYLENRTVRVNINGTFSDPRTLNIGVPQGSVLGPLLFLIYTNSIYRLKLYGNITGFADDLALAYTGKSSTDVVSMINCDLKLLHQWFDKHCLILSEKTKYMFFKISGIPIIPSNNLVTYHSFSNCTTINCQSECFIIELVNSFKYLGVHLDTNLNWKTHVTNLKLYTNSASRIFYLLRDLCPVSVLLMLFHALVMSKLEYGLSCWGGCYTSTLKPLYVQQKMILRTLLRKNRTEPSWPLFKCHNILPLQHLYIYKVLRIFFKRSGQRNIRFDDRYNLRGNNQLLHNIPRFNSDHFRRFFLVTAPTFFNALPDFIRRLIYTKSFLCEIKKWLFETSDVSFLYSVVT